MSGDIQAYITEQRKIGTNDDVIRRNLLSHGWDPIIVHRAMGGQTAPSSQGSSKPTSLHMGASQALLYVGIVCVLVAAVVFISLNWPQLSPLMRFLVVAIPNALLFVIGAFFARSEELDHVQEGTYAAGLLMLPITLGVALYQFGLSSHVDALLLATSTLLSLPVYLYFAFKAERRDSMLLLVMLNLLASFIFLAAAPSITAWFRDLIILCLGATALVVAIAEKRQQQSRYLVVSESVASLLFVYGLPSLIAALGNLIFGDSHDITSFFVSVLGGGGLLLLATRYSKWLQPNTRAEVFQQRALIVLGTFIMFMFLLGGQDNVALFAVISVALSAIIIFFGTVGGVRLMWILGLIGGIFNLLVLLFGQINSIGVLLALFIIGFVAIAVSILLARLKDRSWSAFYHADSANRWGLISDDQARTLQPNNDGTLSAGTIVLRILLIFVLFWVAEIVVGLFFSSLGRPF